MFISTDSLFSVPYVATHFGMKERDTPHSSIRISCKYHVLDNYKVSRNSGERFQRYCVDKKKKTGLTDRLTVWMTD